MQLYPIKSCNTRSILLHEQAKKVFIHENESCCNHLSARRHFSRMSPLFEARATKERVFHLCECAKYVFSYYTIFFETNIMSGVCPCACQSVNRINSHLFSFIRNFHHPNWRNGVLSTRFFYYQVKLFSECSKR
jgi:hypothetical protein